MANELETSGLLYSAMFCINQKNTFFICKYSNFHHNSNYAIEKIKKIAISNDYTFSLFSHSLKGAHFRDVMMKRNLANMHF